MGEPWPTLIYHSKKKLSNLEIREHFIHIPKQYRDEFKPSGPIMLKVGREEEPKKDWKKFNDEYTMLVSLFEESITGIHSSALELA